MKLFHAFALVKTFDFKAFETALALENLHQIDFIHRDIKPSNCCIGMDNKKRIYLVDFGMCRKWLSNDGRVRSPRNKAPFRGTIRYAPSRTLIQQECGSADDLIGWLYSVIELYQIQLPWARVKDVAEVIRMISMIPLTDLCEFMPHTLCDAYTTQKRFKMKKCSFLLQS